MDELGRLFEAVSGYFALLAEPMRVRILHAICQRERTVSDIVAETGATQTNISRHLNSMYRAGVLTRRKEGAYTYYGVRDRALTEICRTVCVHIAARLEAGADGRSGMMDLARGLRAPAGRRRPVRGGTKRPVAGPGAAGPGAVQAGVAGERR